MVEWTKLFYASLVDYEFYTRYGYGLLVKNAERFLFLISQPKHMLWALNETVLFNIC